ncbi:MAG TPA: glycosyltransferase family 39 protein, partial [Terriglobales bacterium]|nr:glycosyltransferase family 39 protein [Terriglobales bacterium]
MQLTLEWRRFASAYRFDLQRVVRWLRWACVCWVVVFWRLGWLSLLDPDEAHYAELTREMMQARSWFVPLLDGSPYIDKPVLFHWLQVLAVRLFGDTEFALRMPSACAAVALFAVTRWVGAALFDEEVGEWGALMFATIPATFALGSIGVFDMVFCAFLFGGVGTLLVSAMRARRRLQYVGFTLVALAVLTKGPVALVLVGLFVGLVVRCADRSRRLILALDWKRGVGVVLLLSVPWFAWMYQMFGAQFVSGYLLAGNLWYFTQPLQFSSRTVSHTFYVRTFLGGFFPWSLVTIGRGIDATRAWRNRHVLPTADAFLWAWVVVVVGFFSVARFKLDTYILPAAPACCLLAARGWRVALNDSRMFATRVSLLLMGVALVGIGAVAAVELFRIDLGLSVGAAVLPAALVVGGTVLVGQTIKGQFNPPHSLLAPLVTLLVAYAATVMVGFPALERTRPVAFAARFLRSHSSDAAPVGL